MNKKTRIVYSADYYVDIGTHVFPTVKYRLIHDKLIAGGVAREKDFVAPEAASDADILLVHTKEYLTKLKKGTLSHKEIVTLELPYSKELVKASSLCAGGTILACRIALEDGVGIHLGGGFHHAFSDHGEGFCVFNDVAIGIKRMLADGAIKRGLVIDCDLHQGNGTASILANDHEIYTFSIHQEDNYPFFKPKSDMDVSLWSGAGEEEYLRELKSRVPLIIDEFKPDLIVYVAGADPYEDDQLGGLKLTMNGLMERDKLVFGEAKKRKTPVAAVLAGGYAKKEEDTVQIHYNMVRIGLGDEIHISSGDV